MSWRLDYTESGEDFFGGQKQVIARLVSDREEVILACNEGDGWFPTWVGPGGGRAVRLLGRWEMSPEMLELLPEVSL